jgi:1-acyl-sn-glycerol-3-phosphate acyltransferase
VPGMADAPRMYRTLRRILPPLVNPYLHVQVEGLERVPEEGGAILASNHLSFIDSIVLPLNVPRPVYFLGKADYWDSWRTRWFFQGTGVVPVHRGGGAEGEASLRTGVEILSRGDLLGIYPEGTRSPDGRLYRGKTGPVRMALEAEVPVVPCAVIGTEKAMPTGNYVPKRRPVVVRFGHPLDLSRYRERRTDPVRAPLGDRRAHVRDHDAGRAGVRRRVRVEGEVGRRRRLRGAAGVHDAVRVRRSGR